MNNVTDHNRRKSDLQPVMVGSGGNINTGSPMALPSQAVQQGVDVPLNFNKG